MWTICLSKVLFQSSTRRMQFLNCFNCQIELSVIATMFTSKCFIDLIRFINFEARGINTPRSQLDSTQRSDLHRFSRRIQPTNSTSKSQDI